MDLFRNRTYLKDLDIWAIRGNHDCYALDAFFEVNLTKRYPTWKMPYLYYNKTFDLGNGKKFLVLFVDSCFAICANQTYAQGTGGSLLASEYPASQLNEERRKLLENMLPLADRKNIRLKDVQCGDDWNTE
jgi:Calcineurin-like phosphoesterase